MARKKIFTKEQLETLSANEINQKIIYENYSLLRTLGAEDLRKEMVPVGKACKTVVEYFVLSTGPKNNYEKHSKNARKKLVKVLSKIAPGEYKGFPKDTRNGLVVGFNHPSLGEIGRIMMMKIDVMGDSTMLFPVNLPWYEALAPFYDKIKMLGIIITPTITPATWKKMKLKKGTLLYEAGNRLKHEFKDMYTNLSHEVIKNGGVIFVAPSATRQEKVFKNKAVYDGTEPIIPTMSVLALRLYKDPEMNCDFLPMAVLPPENYKRGLNMRKKYKLIPGEPMTAEYIRKKYFGDKTPEKLEGFDYEFHRRIADQLPKSFWF
ncbi:MAG: hypothetical protein Q4A36_02230 [Candidatus Saccharibacteria bacterium]|nr:hypothetical protein [Candidatus Saccharibacteria bacterium]